MSENNVSLGPGAMMAIPMRLDGTVSGLVDEVRAQHAKQNRLSIRVRALETAASDGETL